MKFPMPDGTPPPRERVLERLYELAVLKENDHFVYTAGDHGDTYFNKDDVLVDPWASAAVSYHIAAELVIQYDEAVIVGPATAGVAVAHHVSDAAARLNPQASYRTVYADKQGDDDFVFKRRYAKYLKGAAVIVVEDVLNRGKSSATVMVRVRENGGNVVAVSAFCNRGGVTAEHGQPPYAAR